uniref:Uncharacterized protein n=1 Tax=viral metagenome TaxID=1070528 RepID=A0A6H1ZDP6_9ZZZZ
MWISKQELKAMLDFEYTRGWNHAYLPPQEYTQWADELRKIEGMPDYVLNAFKEED